MGRLRGGESQEAPPSSLLVGSKAKEASEEVLSLLGETLLVGALPDPALEAEIAKVAAKMADSSKG